MFPLEDAMVWGTVRLQDGYAIDSLTWVPLFLLRVTRTLRSGCFDMQTSLSGLPPLALLSFYQLEAGQPVSLPDLAQEGRSHCPASVYYALQGMQGTLLDRLNGHSLC